MSISKYQAADLFQWVTSKQPFLLLDVRNAIDFGRFKVAGPYQINMQNISYFDFMEIEDECISRLPGKQTKIRIVCAKEGSAQFVAEILEKHGFTDVGYLAGGIKSWGNLLVPKLIRDHGDYALYQFIRPGKGSCSYGVISNKQMVVFDPSRNDQFYIDFAAAKGAEIIATAETHLQADYIAGSRTISEKTGAIFYANKNDFAAAQLNYTELSDAQQIGFSAGPSITAVFAPGHTPGSTMYVIDNRYIVTGDIIFIKSIGRPDLGGKVEQWSGTLFETIQAVGRLSGKLLVLPGHFIGWDEANPDLTFTTTLETAWQRNQAIYSIDTPEAFLAFIKSNIREQPPEYATIRRVNANLEQVDDQQAEELDLGKNECAASAYAAQQAAVS